MQTTRTTALLTVDLEDYRRQELRDHKSAAEPPHPREVERQLHGTLQILSDINARATFFAVGRLAGEIAPGAWREIGGRHRIGCHGYEHLRVNTLGQAGLERELHRARAVLEDATGNAVISHRAPYFSADGCDPWFGEALARAGFLLDSSRRISVAPDGFRWTLALEGSGGRVREVPLPSIGIGAKRLTVIGGTYFRLLPFARIVGLLEWGRARGFLPMLYLHPYDLDPSAHALDYGPGIRHWRPRLGDAIRRFGRTTAAEKLRRLGALYDFRAIEFLAEGGREEERWTTRADLIQGPKDPNPGPFLSGECLSIP